MFTFPMTMFGASNTSIIQSIQPFSIDISVASNTATITSVNTANSIIIYNGFTTANGGSRFDKVLAKLVLTNSTTVTASVFTTISGVGDVIVNGVVVEFKTSAIQSVQSGNISFGAATSKTATITAVTLANSAVLYAGATLNDTTGQQEPNCLSTVQLTNTTTVTASRDTGSVGATVQYFVLEFAAGFIKSRNEEVTVNSSNPTAATITAVSLSNTILFYGGTTSNSGAPKYRVASHFVSSTEIDVISASGNGSTGAATALEFLQGVASIQSGSIAIGSGATSNTATITSVDTSKSIVIYSGCISTEASSFNYTKDNASIVLTNSTTVTATRNASDTTTATIYFQVVTFI